MVFNNKILKQLENRFENELIKSSDKQIENFLTTVLTKILTSAINKDLYNYNLYKNQLYQSLIIVNSRVKNFNTFYDGIKLKVLNNYMKSLVGLDTDFNVFDNTVVNAEMIEFQKLFDLQKFKDFELALDKMKEPLLVFNNSMYSVVIKYDTVIIYDRYSEKKYADRIVTFDYYEGDLNILKNFIEGNNSDVADIVANDNQNIFNKLKILNFLDSEDYTRVICSSNENDSFIYFVFDEDVIISDKSTNECIILYYGSSTDVIDMYNFFSYCVGKENIK